MEAQVLLSVAKTSYFQFWLVDPAEASRSIEALLKENPYNLPPEYFGELRLLFYIDIDTDNKEFPCPYEVGLTPQAVCFDVSMAETESCFPAVARACAALAPHAQLKLRFGLGRFASQEYDGMRTGSLYTKRMFYNMGAEWILFKNIYRRAGKLGWFWRAWSRWYDKRDN